jgi:hypothetical protein
MQNATLTPQKRPFCRHSVAFLRPLLFSKSGHLPTFFGLFVFLDHTSTLKTHFFLATSHFYFPKVGTKFTKNATPRMQKRRAQVFFTPLFPVTI